MNLEAVSIIEERFFPNFSMRLVTFNEFMYMKMDNPTELVKGRLTSDSFRDVVVPPRRETQESL